MTQIKKILENDVVIYPQTHATAVLKLDETIDEKIINLGAGDVSSVNGKTGEVVLNADDVNALPKDTTIPEYTAATENVDGLMSSNDKAKINKIPEITFELVSEISEEEEGA